MTMYGSAEGTSAAGAMLAVTGMTTASWVLGAIGGAFLLFGLYLLLRKPGKHKP